MANGSKFLRSSEGEPIIPRPGRPKLISGRTNLLVRSAKKDRRQPLAELHNSTCPKVSRQTVRRALKDEDIKKWMAAIIGR